MPARTLRIPLLSRRITVETVADAVRGVVRTGSKPFMRAVYQASKGSPGLAAAIAVAYPFTLCPHEGCPFPIAHGGGHNPVGVMEAPLAGEEAS